MKKLKGIEYKEFPLKNLFKVGDMYYYDGPLTSLFSNTDRELYIYHWIDCDKDYNRWMIYKVKLNQIIDYLNEKVSDYHLQTTSECIYFVDIPTNCELDIIYHNVKKVEVKDIPDDYLSEIGILCEKKLVKDIEKIFDYLKKK